MRKEVLLFFLENLIPLLDMHSKNVRNVGKKIVSGSIGIKPPDRPV